jgi:hypothetical protein
LERTPKERIVAVVVAQGIKWAMRVLTPDEKGMGQVIDSGEGVLCEYVLPSLHFLSNTNQIAQHPSLPLLGFIDYSPSHHTDHSVLLKYF